MATSLDVPLDDLIKSRSGRGRGRGRGQGGGRGRGDGQRLARGSWRGRGAGTFRGRGGLGVPSRRPLGVNTRSSSFVIAKARTKLSLFLSIQRIQITVGFNNFADARWIMKYHGLMNLWFYTNIILSRTIWGYGTLQSFSKTKDFVWRHDLFEDSMVAAGLSGIETGTKLYISNLHYGVTKEDLKVAGSSYVY
ncbi:hypothetical protein PR202_gb17305 [Eleusine coracana subsp. coracana]|uniref:Uncharacterized protein n=1 Tax=Eleusine coracana subsp. coracana TaxID=191504 RepID=A0AAV5F2Q0_ELECO|nr:hypothetical protein PR202_gb17305 [Eleusine coracana subsp. coracana]